MTVRMATNQDIERLVNARFDYFNTENMEIPQEKKRMIRSHLKPYFTDHLNTDCFAALVVDENDNFMSVAMLVLSEKPANPSFPTGKTGLILNVLTYPEHRNKGYATRALRLLIEEAQQQNVSYIELSASEMGKPLYEKLGFREHVSSHFTKMRLNLE